MGKQHCRDCQHVKILKTGFKCSQINEFICQSDMLYHCDDFKAKKAPKKRSEYLCVKCVNRSYIKKGCRTLCLAQDKKRVLPSRIENCTHYED